MATVAELGIKVASDADRATNDLKGLRQEAGLAENALAKLTKAAAALIGAYATWSVAEAIVRKFVDSTIEAERVQARLNAVLKTTGGVVGFTSDQLSQMATDLQRVTVYGDETVKSVQTMLLTFKNVRGEEFRQATEAALDMATVLGSDVESAAIQLGKALQDPINGVTALSRAGVSFSVDQKQLIKSLVETNDLAGAQGVVLKELTGQMGGAARAARQTLGGALLALGEAFGDLFEATGPQSNALRQSVELLINKITDPSFISAVQNLGAALFKAFADVIPVITDLLQRMSIFIASTNAAANDPILSRMRDQGDNATAYLAKRLNNENYSLAGPKTGYADVFAGYQPGASTAPTNAPASFGPTDDQISSQQKLRDSFDAMTASAIRQVQSLNAQAQAMGMSYKAGLELSTTSDLLSQAQEKGIPLTDDYRAQIDVLAESLVNAQIAADGMQVTLDNQTIWETTRNEIEKLNEMLDEGAISWETYARAVGETTANATSQALGAIANLASGLSSAFEDSKALSIATAVLKGAEAIASAYAEGNKYFGPAGGAAFAAVAAITAAANVAAVASTTKTSKSISGTSTGGTAAASTSAATTQRVGTTIILNGKASDTTSLGSVKSILDELSSELDGQGLQLVTKFKGE